MNFVKNSIFAELAEKSSSTYGNLGFTLPFEYILKQLNPAEKQGTYYLICVLI
jgi:hypothetical protein